MSDKAKVQHIRQETYVIRREGTLPSLVVRTSSDSQGIEVSLGASGLITAGEAQALIEALTRAIADVGGQG